MTHRSQTALGSTRLVLTFVTTVMVSAIGARPALAQCQTGVGLFDYTPHRLDGEAEYLAMELSGALRAPDDEYNRIHRDLGLIRSAVPAVNIVQFHGAYAPDQMFVRLEIDLSQDGFDQLNAFYQVIDDREYTIVPGLHVLTFCDTLNIPALAPEYEVLPEVRYAGPNYSIGDGDDISVTPIGTTYRYEFDHGSGDCASGCLCRQYWTVDVLEDGVLTEVLSWDEGWCAACCREGDCERVYAGDCTWSGGTVVGACLGDSDGDGSDDACTAGFWPAPPEPDVLPDTGGFMVTNTKGRFLSFYTTDLGRIQAMRVTFMDLPPPYDLWNGRSMWVDDPIEVPSCSGLCGPGPPPPPFTMATLRCGGPAFRDWASVGVVHVHHEGIVPGGTYRVEVMDEVLPSTFSDPLEMTTAVYGDTVGNLSGDPPPPPNGPPVSIDDALAIIARFSSVPGAIILPRADLEPACVDFTINISDVLSSLRGFSGLPYPFTPSAADPCDATCAMP